MSPKTNPTRKRTPFGDYLTSLRKDRTEMNLAQAATELGLKSRQLLDSYETGEVKPPDSILITMAQLYRIHPDEILRKAHWPQLILLPLVSIIDWEQLTDEMLREIENGLGKTEREQLTQYLMELLSGRRKILQS